MQQFFARTEGAIFVAVSHDFVGQGGADATDVAQQFATGCVEFYSHAVDATHDNVVEFGGE